MDQHEETAEALAAWVLGACEPVEAAAVAAHVETCPDCSAEAARLRATGLAVEARPLPAPLKGEVLAAALRARPAGSAVTAPLVAAYEQQIEALDDLLGTLGPATWQAEDARHGTVEAMLVHLADNDARLAGELGLPVLEPAAGAEPETVGAGELRRRWRVQAGALASYSSAPTALLDREVTLAGPRPARAPAHAALVQRGFETWIHADDVRLALGLPCEPPPPDQLRRIAELGIGLLPAALRAAGRQHPGRTARLTLTGDAGGSWTVPLDAGSAPGAPDVAVTADLESFTRLLANRRTPADLEHDSDGDPAVVADILYAASTLGCD